MRLLVRTIALILACFGLHCVSLVGQVAGAQAEVEESAEISEHASDSEADEHDEHAAEGDHSGDGEHAAHDLDPTHGNMTDQTYEIVDFRTDIAFFTLIVFLLLLAGLWFTAWKPIMQALEKRERGIADHIAQAERASAEASEKLAEYEAKLATAGEEAQQLVASAKKDAEAAGQKLIESAQAEADRQRDRAVADIESAKRAALSDLANQSAGIAMSLAGRVVGREVKAEDHQGMIQEMLDQLPSNN